MQEGLYFGFSAEVVNRIIVAILDLLPIQDMFGLTGFNRVQLKFKL